MAKKFAAMTIAVILLASVMLTACGQPAAEPQAQAPAAAAPAPAPAAPAPEASAEAVELKLWTGTWHEDIQPQLAEQFTKENPNIVISSEYYPWDGMNDRYLVALQADNGPDIIDLAVAWTIPFASMGKLQKLDSYIQAENVDMSDYFDGPLETCTTDGGYYALPYRSESIAMFYNKKLFREAGLDPEKPPVTYAELVEYAKQLTSGDVYGFGMCGKEAGNVTVQIYSAMLANGAKILSDDLTKSEFNSPEGLEGFKMWANMALVDKSVPASVLENDNTTNRNLFAQEKIGIYFSGNYDVAPILEANPNIEMGFAVVPKIKINSTQIGGWSLGITNTCKSPEEAFKFVKFICSTDIAPQYSLTFPALRSATSNAKYADPDLKPFLEAIEYARPLPPSARMNEITNIMYEQAQAVISGLKTPEVALQEAADEVDALLAE